MSETLRLKLPRIDAAQSQKHVTHNEALEALDALSHLSVSARNVATPPASPVEGLVVLVGAAPQDGFAGQALKVAAFGDGAWRFYAPRMGWCAFVESEGLFYVFDGVDWVKQRIDMQDVQNLRFAGIGTSADAQNPLAAKLNGALFAARSVAEGGTGDLRITLNRAAGMNVVSQLYQSNWSGRVETGLLGDDTYRIKVSADGASWKEALNIDPLTGRVRFPNGYGEPVPPVDPKAQVINKANSFLFTPFSVGEGGTGDVRFTLNRAQGSNIVSQLYQSNWSGRAETGLMADDRFRIKVSADGAAWKDALYADPATGRVFFPNGASDLAAAAVLTAGTPSAYTLSAPLRGPLPDGALFWMVPHVPNATALNVDPTLQIDQIDVAPVPLRNFDGSVLSQGALEANRAVAVRKSGALYCVQGLRASTFVNLLEDGGRFAGTTEPVPAGVATFADATWITSVNGAVRANYGLARAATGLAVPIADLLNKFRPAAAQAGGSEFFVLQVTAGTGVTSPVVVQSTTFYPALASARHIGRGVTLGAYVRVISGSLVMACADNVPRMLVDGVAHNFSADTPARLFNAAAGWKHMQMWVAPNNGATTSLWPFRVTPGTVFLLALPAVVQGFETLPWDLGPLPSYRVWR